MDPTNKVIAYARTYFGVHYSWGGNTRYAGMDCSGFVCDVLRRSGIVPRNVDFSSQSLYDHLLSKGTKKSKPVRGAILFFGSSSKNLTHVAVALCPIYMIESGGGGRSTLTVEDAVKINAGVRESLIASRADLVDTLLPVYP